MSVAMYNFHSCPLDVSEIAILDIIANVTIADH